MNKSCTAPPKSNHDELPFIREIDVRGVFDLFVVVENPIKPDSNEVKVADGEKDEEKQSEEVPDSALANGVERELALNQEHEELKDDEDAEASENIGEVDRRLVGLNFLLLYAVLL